MESVVHSKFTFLSPSGHEKPVREKELEHALIRAHAARISHQRKSWYKGQQKSKRRDGEKKAGVAPQSRELSLLLQSFHGSSDPFNAYPVKITPEMNRIIGYARDVMLPNIYCPPYFRRLTVGGPKWVTYERSDKVIGGSNFHFNIKLFSDMSEGAALAWLCSHIPPILILNSPEATPTLSLMRLKMRAKSIRILREELADDPQSSPESLAALRLHIRTLYEAECMAGDTTAARAHVKILLRLDDPVTDELVRFQHLLVMMFNATELACKKLERTVLPFGNWISQRFRSLWAYSQSYMPIAPDTINDTHASVTIFPLREAMVRLRYCLWVGETPLPFATIPDRFNAEMMFAWIASKSFNDLGVLINLYMDISEDKISFRFEGGRFVQGCVALTLLYMIRKCMHEAIIEDGTDIRDASHIIIPRLQQEIVTAVEMMTPAEILYYREAFLWMFYAGANYEQRQANTSRDMSSPPSLPAQDWFTVMLVKHTAEMKITTWEQARNILQKFVYDKHLEPDGHAWFEDALHSESSVESPLPLDITQQTPSRSTGFNEIHSPAELEDTSHV